MPASKRIIKPGEKFGFLVVLAYVGKNQRGQKLWKCRCTNCLKHTTIVIQQSHLTSGHTKSCGCLKNTIHVQIGQQFGFLIVLAYAGRNRYGVKMWKCHCIRCPEQKVCSVGQYHLVSGRTKSCGCLHDDKARERTSAARGSKRLGFMHGGTSTPEHKIWHGMIARCTNPRNVAWSRYGGAGVKVCRRWLGLKKGEGFINFLNDVGKRPSPKHSIGRYLDLGDYAPGNCQWMTKEEQEVEKRKKRMEAHISPKHCKLRPSDISEIRELSSAGIFQKIIAKQFGVKQSAISAVVTKKTWRNFKRQTWLPQRKSRRNK